MIKYKLEKFVNGQWWVEGIYQEGAYVSNLAEAAFSLGAAGYDKIRVTIMDTSKEQCSAIVHG